MPDMERTRRADNSDEIGDNRQENAEEITGTQGDSRSSSESQMGASSRSQRSTADDVDESGRQRRGEGYGEVY